MCDGFQNLPIMYKIICHVLDFYGEILCPPGTGTRQVSAASSRSATSLALLVVVGDC